MRSEKQSGARLWRACSYHGEEFGFCSTSNMKPLEGFELRSNLT